MMNDAGHEASAAKTWIIVALLLSIVGFQGALAYFVVGDQGQPDWDLRPVKDVPAESPYAVYEYFPFPQHVKGDADDYPPLEGIWGAPYAVYDQAPSEQLVEGDVADQPLLPRNWDKTMFPAPQQNAIGNR